MKMKKRLKPKKMGKTFKKGDQCVQNPMTSKHRDSVKRSVFTNRKTSNGLTVAALKKHDEALDDEISLSGLTLSEASAVSKKSKAFSISGLTDCSNITFHHVLDKWSSTNSMDQEKCAILAAVTEVIRSKGGSETEAEYFAALMTALEASNDENSSTAISFLLSLVVKKVPNAILKRKLSETSRCLIGLLERYYEDGRSSLLMALLQCLTAVLMVQEPAVWSESSTLHTFQILLTFTIHSKPKVRKVAHSSVQSLLKLNLLNHRKHPIGNATSKFCMQIIEQHSNETATTPHHILNLLKQCLQYFNAENLKGLCETILRLLSVKNTILKTNTMGTLSCMFDANPATENLSADLNMKLIAVFYEFQPNVNDVAIAKSWLSLLLAGHTNLSIIDDKSCLKILPLFYGKAVKFLLSEHREVVVAAANVMKQTSEKCIEPALSLVEEDIKSEDSSFIKIYEHIESALGYKYAPVWDVVLQSLQYLYLSFGSSCASVFAPSIGNLIDLHESSDFPFMSDLDKAVGAAVKAMGPELVLNERPLNLIRKDGICEFPRGWLLPVMKDNIENTQLQFFTSHFLPMAAQIRQKAMKCRESKQDLEAKVYETLLLQIWSLLPGFCTKPVDIKDSFKNIAKILGTALNERSDLRPVVLQALRALIYKTMDEEELKCIGQYSKNYLPILFNLYTSDNEDCQQLCLSVLETIKGFLIVTDTQLISVFITKMLEKLNEETQALKRHKLMDLAVIMVKYSEGSVLRSLYQLAVDNVKEKDKSMQKKAYRIIEEFLDSNSEHCKRLREEKFEELKLLLVDSLSMTTPSAKAPRLRCLSAIVKKLDEKNKDFLNTIIPEVILCTKAVGVKAKTAAFDLIVDIGSAYVYLSNLPKEDCIEKYFEFVMAGLAGSPHMISATLLTFTKLIFEYRYCIQAKLVASLLEMAIELLKSKTGEVVKSSLYFVKAVVKILDANELSGHLELLIKNLFSWNTQSKNAYRVQIRSILEKLELKCGYDLIRPLVPEAHRKFIIHIHKTRERNKRRKETRNVNLKEENYNVKYDERDKENTWEDILEESDDDDNFKQSKNKKSRNLKETNHHSKTWIVEGDEAVDLLDPSASKRVVATKPKKQYKGKQKENDFSFSSDGRMVIKDDEENGGDSLLEDKPLDVGATDILGGFSNAPKQIKLGKRKQVEEMPEDDEASQYQPGGMGIHRKRGEPAIKKKYGEEYKAKKSDGDVKLKGKPDPFAYIPLNRQKLNKRKKAKLSGQFQGMVKAARKGAAKGTKYRKNVHK